MTQIATDYRGYLFFRELWHIPDHACWEVAIAPGLKSALEHSKVKLLNHEIQKKELLSFEEKGTTNGSFSYSAPSGLHDDCVMPLYVPTLYPLCPHKGGL